jgi:hypothetical protein
MVVDAANDKYNGHHSLEQPSSSSSFVCQKQNDHVGKGIKKWEEARQQFQCREKMFPNEPRRLVLCVVRKIIFFLFWLPKK